MNNVTKRGDLTKRSDRPTAPVQQDAANRLKRAMLEEMFGEDKPPSAPDTSQPARVLLAINHHAGRGYHDAGWTYAVALQRQMFETAGDNLEMKFAFWGGDNSAGIRRYRITTNWITSPDDMASIMGRSSCDCGCYVYIENCLRNAVEQNRDRPMQAVIIIGDTFHDHADQDRLDEAALYANQLRRAGTKVFLIHRPYAPSKNQDDIVSERNLKYIAKVSGAAYFEVGHKPQLFAEMVETISAFAKGGEAAVKEKGGEAAALMLEYLKQEPMPILNDDLLKEKVKVRIDAKEGY
jgi:hypothetical protein